MTKKSISRVAVLLIPSETFVETNHFGCESPEDLSRLKLGKGGSVSGSEP
jgi:hypothetical protein